MVGDDAGRARALNELGIICKYTGRFDEGRALYERALSLVAPDSVDAASILHNIGGLEHARDRYAEAESPARRAVATRERALGADHVEAAKDRAALAAIVDGLGRTDEAEALLRDALAVFERQLGPDHHEVGVTLANLAAIAHRRGELAEAEGLHRRALAIKQRTLGTEHPELAITLANLGTTLRAAGRSDEAERSTAGRWRCSKAASSPTSRRSRSSVARSAAGTTRTLDLLCHDRGPSRAEE